MDHAATTPVHPDVRAAMMPFLEEQFGNPSSIHRYGRDVRAAIDSARDTVAAALNCDPARIVFTSGGTEADNTAVLGVALAMQDKGKHVVTTAIEHSAVLDACAYLETLGFDVTRVPVDEMGMVRVEDVEQALTEDTVLISVMYANNEVGTVQPVAEIGQLARERDIFFHTDAVQAFGVLPIDPGALSADLVTLSSHKINGPKGVGALYVGRKVPLTARLHGGSQERKHRPGTENVPGIVGFGKAVEITAAKVEEKRENMLSLRQAMINVWQEAGIPFTVNGHPTSVVPQILNVSFPGVDTETLLITLDLAGVACASGSACMSGSFQASHVLEAMRLPPEVTASAVRFSFGRGNSVDEVTEAAEKVVELVKQKHLNVI